MDSALQLVEKNRGKVHENGTSGVRFGEEEEEETEKAQRQEEQDQFAWHEGTRE